MASVRKQAYSRVSSFKSARLLSVFVAVAAWGAQAQTSPYASDPSTLLGASSLSRGGATVASPLTHDSLFQNPASAAFSNSYAVSAGYLGAGNALFGSIVDTKSGPIGGGVYYLRRDLRDLDGTDASLGNYDHYEEIAGLTMLGKIQNNIALGANVRYSYHRSYDNRITNGTGWNFDGGAQYLVNTQFMLGFLAQNIMPNSTSLFPTRFGAGASYMLLPNLVLSAQVFKVKEMPSDSKLTLPNVDKTIDYAGGVDFSPTQGLNLRGGYHENPAWNDRRISLGGGYLSKSFSVDYAFDWSPKNTKLFSHTLTLTGFF